MTANATAMTPENQGWLYSRSFDNFFIYGVAGLSISLGLVAYFVPALFGPILALNIWVLGYHHVIATYSRLCFDQQSHRRSLWMLYGLFPAVFGAVMLLANTFGIWVIATIYLYAQWFHYSRQSWGISRAYERNSPAGYVADRSWQTQVAFYGLPVWGILYQSWRAPETFLTLDLKVLPVMWEVVVAAGVITTTFFLHWLVRVYKDWRQGVLPKAYVGFMFSHFGIFSFGYLLMPTLDSGWLIVNIWHNLQYILFVWLFNNRSYKNGIDPKAKFLSFISQKSNAWLYFGLMLFITTAVYSAIHFSLYSYGLMALVVVYMTINFHHYIVDGIIWRANWIRKGKAAAPEAVKNG